MTADAGRQPGHRSPPNRHLDYHLQVPEVSLHTTIGRYRLLEKIGQGGMGVVHRAHDTLLEREVALKIIATSIQDNPELRERFFREARAAGQLSHRNIITIHDLGEHEGQPYLAMEFLTGEDLQHRLARQEPMGLRRKLEVAAEICDGLSYAHRRGLVHRDVKPANIFITDDGVVKLLDFGLARMVASELTRSNMMMGTLNYMAPEQVRGERTDHRSDIFSFGVVLYEMLSGRKAFQGDSFATTLYKILQDVPEPLLNIDSTLPHELVWIVERTLAKPKDERYQDLADVARDLAIVRQNLGGVDAVTMAGSAGGGPPRIPSDPPRSSGATPRSDANLTTFSPTPALATPASSSGSRPASWKPLAIAGPVLVVLAIAAAQFGLFGGRDEPAPQEPATRAVSPPPAVTSQPLPPPPQAEPPAPVPPAGQDESPQAQRKSADDARQRMTRAKAAARQAGAAAIASQSYKAAAAAEQDANRLYRARQLSEAAAKFYEATGLFRSAELTTPIAPQPQPQPQRAEPQAPTAAQPPPVPPVQVPAPAPATESQVQLPPAPAPRVPPAAEPQPSRPPPATTPVESAATSVSSETAIRDLLSRYRQALESRNIDALKRIWPTIPDNQEDALRNEFRQARRIEVEIDDTNITVSGSSATVTFVRRYHLSTVDNQRLDTTSRTTMTVRRSGGEWVVDRVRYEAIR